jgi:hypothetical protein
MEMKHPMTIEQTVEIPPDHRLTIEVPPEIPAGRAILAFTPAGNGETTVAVKDHRYWKAASLAELDAEVERRLGRPPVGDQELKLFRALIRSYGAWADKPWENYIDDIRAIRDEWDHRDPWNPDPSRHHRA